MLDIKLWTGYRLSNLLSAPLTLEVILNRGEYLLELVLEAWR